MLCVIENYVHTSNHYINAQSKKSTYAIHRAKAFPRTGCGSFRKEGESFRKEGEGGLFRRKLKDETHTISALMFALWDLKNRAARNWVATGSDSPSCKAFNTSFKDMPNCLGR